MYTTGEGNTPSQETKRAGKIGEAPSSHDHCSETGSLAMLEHPDREEAVWIGPRARGQLRVSLTRDSE